MYSQGVVRPQSGSLPQKHSQLCRNEEPAVHAKNADRLCVVIDCPLLPLLSSSTGLLCGVGHLVCTDTCMVLDT